MGAVTPDMNLMVQSTLAICADYINESETWDEWSKKWDSLETAIWAWLCEQTAEDEKPKERNVTP